MADNKIVITASLDFTASTKNISNDLKNIADKLNADKAFKVIVNADLSKTQTRIQSQLNTISKNLKLDVGNVNVDNVNTQNISGGLRDVQIQAQHAVNEINKIGQSVLDINVKSPDLKFFADIKESTGDVILDLKKTQENARSMFANMGFSDVSFRWVDEAEGLFEKLTVSVKDAYGAVQNFQFVNESGDNYFRLAKVVGTDEGVKKQSQSLQEFHSRYTRLLADFKSSHSAIESGLTQPIYNVQTALDGLKNGTHTIQDVKLAFEGLKTSASEISKHLDTTQKSFNKSTNAINNYKEFDKTLSTLGTTFDNLTLKPDGLSQELEVVRAKVLNLQELEKSQGGFTAEWAKEYQKVNLAVSELKSNIELAQKAETNSKKADKNSDYQTQAKYLKKIKEETNLILSYKKKIINAGTEESAIYEHEIKKAEKRIKYDVQQLEKKQLLTVEAQQLVNTYERQIELQDEINEAKTEDKSTKQQISQIEAYNKELNSLLSKLNSLNSDKTLGKYSTNSGVQEQKNQIQELIIKVQELKTKLGESASPEFLEQIDKELEGLKMSFDTVNQSCTNLKTTLSTNTDLRKLSQDVDNLRTRIIAFRNANGRSEKDFGGAYESLLRQLDEIDKKTANGIIDSEAFDVTKRGFRNLQTQVKETGLTGQSFFKTLGDQIKKFSQWMSLTTVIASFAGDVRKAVQELREIDTILTEISKTSDLTENSLKKLGEASFDTASKYGKKASNYLVGVQEMYRAGFANAEEMSELSILAQAAGDMESTSANDYIMATNAAYDYKGSVEELNKVLDSQNYITNNAAISLQDMADATTEAASIAAQYGVEIDELSALISVATSKTRESGAEVGTALKALFVNLQDTTSAPIKAAFDAVNISMTEMVDGTEKLKTPIELIKELSVAFNSLDEGDIRRANILNDIGGKHHANTLSAILSDLNSYYDMLDLYSQGEGSAMKEAMKSAENWEGRLNALSNSWTELVNNFANSDMITTGIEILTDFVEILDVLVNKAGALPTIGTAIGTALSFKNVGEQNTPVYVQSLYYVHRM